MSDAEVNYSRRPSYSSDSFHSDEGSMKELESGSAQKNSKYPASTGKPNRFYAGSTRNASRNSTSQYGNHVAGNAARRMLSAGRIKINELRNKITELTIQLTNVQAENKQLLRQLRQQERQLARFDKEESDAPAAVQRISEEANALREQLKRYREKYDSKSKKLQEVNEELERTQRLLKKMKNLVDDKKLAERDELARKLEKARTELEVKEETVKELKSHIEHLNKNHKHELGIERARHRETRRLFEESQAFAGRLQMQLKEKEKELEVRNIYALRQHKPPHRLDNSISSTPVPEVRYVTKLKLHNIHSETQQGFETSPRNEHPNEKQEEAAARSDDNIGHRNNEGETRRCQPLEQSRQQSEEQRFGSNLRDAKETEAPLQLNELYTRDQMQQAYEQNDFGLHEKEVKHEVEEHEESRRLTNPSVVHMQKDTEEQERLRQKELLLAKMRAIDEGNFDSSVKSLDHAKNSQFKHQESNVHDFGLTFGDYKPSFLTSSTNTPTVNKKLPDKRAFQLHSVSDNTPASPNFATTTDHATVSPIDGKDFEKTLDDYLLPRRARQPLLAMTKSTKMSAASDVNDDVEEVTL